MLHKVITLINFHIWVAVFKFVEQPENNERPLDQKSNVKFKIVSLKVNGPVEYVPELVSLSIPFFQPDWNCFFLFGRACLKYLI